MNLGDRGNLLRLPRQRRTRRRGLLHLAGHPLADRVSDLTHQPAALLLGDLAQRRIQRRAQHRRQLRRVPHHHRATASRDRSVVLGGRERLDHPRQPTRRPPALTANDAPDDPPAPDVNAAPDASSGNAANSSTPSPQRSRAAPYGAPPTSTTPTRGRLAQHLDRLDRPIHPRHRRLRRRRRLTHQQQRQLGRTSPHRRLRRHQPTIGERQHIRSTASQPGEPRPPPPQRRTGLRRTRRRTRTTRSPDGNACVWRSTAPTNDHCQPPPTPTPATPPTAPTPPRRRQRDHTPTTTADAARRHRRQQQRRRRRPRRTARRAHGDQRHPPTPDAPHRRRSSSHRRRPRAAQSSTAQHASTRSTRRLRRQRSVVSVGRERLGRIDHHRR